ncbi:uncharacterized protein Aud_007788 [Aspergillus udagawae]|uniref:Trichothecene 3-O-acetyltransferase n=1 Tax=Aspergillus udagawae TaxID=91492 RepID=A0A8E0V2Q6_9EURO|nr:uncharacterized protein Aud_007788 [Aspergillus udagawae]GIC91345.1 hypothetical protein Aud_007788 [Aspergillus udagawae]
MREALAEAGKDRARFEEKFMPIGLVPDVTEPCPILVVQANLHPDGVLLSVAANHMVMDATGMGTAIVMFADCCRQVEQGKDIDMSVYAAEQDIGKEMLLYRLPAYIGEREFSEYRVHKDLYAKWEKMTQNVQNDSFSIRTKNFNIAAKDVNALKGCCNELLPHLLVDEGHSVGEEESHDRPWVSSSDVVIALVWLSLTRARYPGLTADNCNSHSKRQAGEPAYVGVGVPVDIRHRVTPPLPTSYLGNAAILMLVNQPLQTFASHEWMRTLCRVAYGIRCGLSRMDNDYIRSLLHYVQNEKSPVIFSFDVANFYVSNWRDMNFYNADFGSKMGRPQQVRNPDSATDGVVFIMPKRPNSESPWEVQVSFNDEVLQRLERDSMWTKYMLQDSYWP